MKKIAPIGLLAIGGGGDNLPSYSDADAGKALTVSELGGLEWKSGGKKLYLHKIRYALTTSTAVYAYLTIISDKSTKYTYDELAQYIKDMTGSQSQYSHKYFVVNSFVENGVLTNMGYYSVTVSNKPTIYNYYTQTNLSNGTTTSGGGQVVSAKIQDEGVIEL